ncbi:pilus assembly protein PilM [Jeotgalibaca sp. MA1X17-3]|uniref:type IV pilus biogenesis protein PilM n=1 Tax=Jeotgalibaca sp. MA1X17-3 TaxID=2908211 RepID=UPI001F2D5EDA|nr:pilus assembly protein PilM [Jeotgalibaca sp. MA1X17-3]UJF14833.1 pilus assembly protein PilM [Jeotgalibaca sp. MA1X17-3]
MFFSKKPLLYIELLERQIRYIAVDSQSKSILETEEILFDTEIIHEGKLINPSLVENRLKALVTEKKWKNAKTSILLPDDFILIREEQVPSQLNEAEIKEYIDLHMNQLIRSPFKQTSFHFEVLEKQEAEQTILLILYPKEVIHQYKLLLETVGLNPIVADISSLSIYRAIREQEKVVVDDSRHILVLQMNRSSNLITVFNKGIPKFVRQSKPDYLTDSWELTEEGTWEWKGSEEAFEDSTNVMLDSLERFLEFYRYSVMNKEGSVTDIFLIGNFTNLKEIQDRLSKRFYIPINILSVHEPIKSAFLPLYGLSIKTEKNSNPPKIKQRKKKKVEN